MCILFIAVDQHPDYPLIIAANRDEFHARLTQPSHFWKSKPHMLAGKDLQAGGTWLGVAKNGHIAALTNIRAPSKERFDAMTRGELVVNALQYKGSWEVHTQHLKNTATDYNGFNLVYGDWKNLQVFNSHTQEHHALKQGVYGLSNAQLNTPWPKTQQGVNALNALCQSKQPLVVEQLFAILSDP
ncbi:MAG: NRDE family protein, partial [Glaciecola sp.]